MEALLTPAFTLDVTGGLGAAVIALTGEEASWFNLDEMHAFAQQNRGSWQGIRIGKVDDEAARQGLAKETEAVHRNFRRPLKAAEDKERRCLKWLVRYSALFESLPFRVSLTHSSFLQTTSSNKCVSLSLVSLYRPLHCSALLCPADLTLLC